MLAVKISVRGWEKLGSGMEEVRAANKEYVKNFGFRADLGGTPSNNLAVLTCMDARVEPMKILGLDLGEANVIRNAGARVTDDAIRSLTASTRLLGADTIFVLHHTNCGMAKQTDEEVIEAVSGGDDEVREAAEKIEWGTIDSEPAALIEDVQKLRESPLIASDVAIHGLLLDIDTGEVVEVAEATDLGTSAS